MYSSEINLKSSGIQGYLIRLEKPTVATLLKSSQIPSSKLLSAPETFENKKSTRKDEKDHRPDTNSNRLFVNEEKKTQPLVFSLKYDISNEIYLGEILESTNNYYDYMLSDRSKLVLESNRNMKISPGIEESIFLSQRGDPFGIQSMHIEDSKLPVHFLESSRENQLSSKRSNAINESNLLKKFELKLREEDNKDANENIQEKKEKIEYGQGIRTLQLFGNRMYDLDDLKKELDRSSEEDSKDNEDEGGEMKGENKNKTDKFGLVNEEDEEEFEDNTSFFKSRKRFKNLVVHANSKRFLPNIKLNISGLILVISIAIISIVFEVYNLQGINNIKNSYQLIKASSQRLFLSQEILNRVFELKMLNLGILTNTPTNYEAIVRTKLEDTITLLSNYHNYIIFNSFGFSPEHTKLMYDKSTSVAFYNVGEISFQNFDINDATNQLISKAYSNAKELLVNITDTNPNVFFIIYNLLNGCYISSKNSLKYFIGDLVYMIINSEDLLVYSIVISVLMLLLGSVFLIYFYVKISQYENYILSIFLEIPIPKAKLLFLKCEAFLTQMQQGNEDDDLMESENLSNDSDNNDNLLDSSKKTNKKRKKTKIIYVGLKGFILKILLLVGVVEGFFVLKYSFYKNIFDNQMSIQSEINSTLFANAMCGILVNAMRQNLYDPTMVIENKTASNTINIQLEQLADVFTNLKRVLK